MAAINITFHAAGAVSGEAKTRVLELVSLAGRVAVASHEGAVDRIPTPGCEGDAHGRRLTVTEALTGVATFPS